jgi:hypothetical protein
MPKSHISSNVHQKIWHGYRWQHHASAAYPWLQCLKLRFFFGSLPGDARVLIFPRKSNGRQQCSLSTVENKLLENTQAYWGCVNHCIFIAPAVLSLACYCPERILECFSVAHHDNVQRTSIDVNTSKTFYIVNGACTFCTWRCHSIQFFHLKLSVKHESLVFCQ